MGAMQHLGKGNTADATQVAEIVQRETDGMAEDRQKAIKKAKLSKYVILCFNTDF